LRQIARSPEPVALVITDMVMPGGGGAKLARTLSDRPSPPRMLFISGYSNLTPDELVPYGRLLPKPFTPAQLLAAVERSLLEPSSEATPPAP
jgi:CheY-like chemotaxis protein